MPDSLPPCPMRQPSMLPGPQEPPSFVHHNTGRDPGDEQDRHLVTVWRADHTSCGCHTVGDADLAAHVAALEAKGWINRTASCEYWDFGAKAWVQGSGRQRVVDIPARPRERGAANAVHTLRQLIVSPTATLTAADRERIRHALRSVRLVEARLEEALDSNRRVDALHAATLGADAGIACATVAGLIGQAK